jgi:hypothetical protein
MPKITRSTGAETLILSTVSQVIDVGDIGEVQVTIVGDASTGTLTMQRRFGKHDTFRTFAPQGVAQTFTNTTLSGATAEHQETYIVGGCQLRFSLATAGTLTIYVDGQYVTPRDISIT